MTTLVPAEAKFTGEGRRPTCTWHCAGCDGCFHSLTAFEYHRCGEPGERDCTHPLDVKKDDGSERLRAWTEDGWCDKATGTWQDGSRLSYAHPVTIWQMNQKEADDDA